MKPKNRYNGYLNLQLENILNAGEEFRLNWKSDGNSQTTFNTLLEIPYLLKARFEEDTNKYIQTR
jgi:hypothetical protein